MDRYLQDINFLKDLDSFHILKKHVKISILDDMERIIKDLTGMVKDGGSVNADGASAIRRTASLTIVTDIKDEQDRAYIEDLFSINKKVKIEVGYDNILKERYPEYSNLDIIWFPLGIFYMTSPSFNHSVEEFSITLQLNDKMCKLNGENGGTIPADIELDKVDTFIPEVDSNGNPTGKMIESTGNLISIRQIIYELVNHMGGEQLSKVIVDIPEKVKTVKRTYEKYLNLYKTSFDNDIRLAISTEEEQSDADKIFKPSEDIGFAYECFTYPSGGNNGLTATAGSSIVDNLDKIKNTLNNYEYFYDIDGNFVYQEIKNYLNTSQSMNVLEILNKDGIINNFTIDYSMDKYHSKSVYSFDNNELIINCNNNPQYEQIKNDFIVWGKKGSNKMPIRYHVVLDKKPYTENKKYEEYFIEYPIAGNIDIENDLPYTMGLRKLEVYDTLNELNALEKGLLGVFYYVKSNSTIYTYDGSEFISLQEHLGDAYKPDYYIVHSPSEAPYINASDWRTQLYLDGVCNENEGIEANDYYIELKNEWVKIIDVKKLFKNPNKAKNFEDLKKDGLNETNIDYFLDFLDTSDKISRFNVSSIGKRTMVISDSESQANCLFENDIPTYCYIKMKEKRKNKNISSFFTQSLINKYKKEIDEIKSYHYTPVLVAFDDYQNIINGGILQSAYEVAKNAIYQYTGYNEKITLDVLPIYHLEPNTRISVYDLESGINGDYIIDSISFPLDINSSMSLTCSRALDKL